MKVIWCLRSGILVTVLSSICLAQNRPSQGVPNDPQTISQLFDIFQTIEGGGNSGGGLNCPTRCSDAGRQVVCGTDNKAYRSECHLVLARCNGNAGLRKKNDGPCITSNPDRGTSNTAVRGSCISHCTTEHEPVCGTNGLTYDNECLMSNAACVNANLRVKHTGSCVTAQSSASRPGVGSSVQPQRVAGSNSDNSNSRPTVVSAVQVPLGAPVKPFGVGTPAVGGTSSGSNRPSSAASPVVSNRQPDCPDLCSPGSRPVCGTDGNVYANICKLRVATCRNPNVLLKNQGPCIRNCNFECNLVVEPVCGTDGITYRNFCELKTANCKDPAIQRAAFGRCSSNRIQSCASPACSRAYEPMCGSDGRTYPNMCALLARNCVNKGLLRVYEGECRADRSFQCDDRCPPEDRPVCGSDRKTYPNHCTLIVSSCRGPRVTLASYGPCQRK